ncbi:P-loop containing nucleoside triphosphate hydrolase protein [Mycena olivaceomarginata]|nr:P-loop containing nucleoside triphosphate hydrolase protein [Mycena olivaceomarginata]
MLPPEPKIFHGRESELSDILKLFHQSAPRIIILGTAGMGKTSLAQAVVHHPEIAAKYGQLRFFVACDSATTKVELATLIGAHLGLKPDRDLTQAIMTHFHSTPSTLLILDNLETLWEPAESRGDVEEFLSLLTGIDHLALPGYPLLTSQQITMRGAERPAKVSWSRPFLGPLQPLDHEAALQIFLEITDDTVNREEVDKVLLLTDNLPLAISLLAHLVDSEGCSNILSRWEQENTALISDGYDRRSNLDLSISLSLSSPRLKTVSGAQELLSLLSILPDGLSDAELIQTGIPITQILGCKAALVRTALAYNNKQQRIRALVPIREYIRRIHPPGDQLVRPLLQHFQELLEIYTKFNNGATSNSWIIARVSTNYANIQNVLSHGLQPGHPDLINSIYCSCHLTNFSAATGRGRISVFTQIPELLLQSHNAQLRTYFILGLFGSWAQYPIHNPQTLIAQALKDFDDFDDGDLKCEHNQ